MLFEQDSILGPNPTQAHRLSPTSVNHAQQSFKKQPTVATLSIKAMHIASSNAIRKTIWLRILLTELDYLQVTATIIYANNQGCIALTHSLVNHLHAKYIDIKHCFTKQVPHKAFVRFRQRLGVISISY